MITLQLFNYGGDDEYTDVHSIKSALEVMCA